MFDIRTSVRAHPFSSCAVRRGAAHLHGAQKQYSTTKYRVILSTEVKKNTSSSRPQMTLYMYIHSCCKHASKRAHVRASAHEVANTDSAAHSDHAFLTDLLNSYDLFEFYRKAS